MFTGKRIITQMNSSETDFIDLSESFTSTSSRFKYGSESTLTNSITSLWNTVVIEEQIAIATSRNLENSGAKGESFYIKKPHEDCYFYSSKFKKRRVENLEHKQNLFRFRSWSSVVLSLQKRKLKSARLDAFSHNSNKCYRISKNLIQSLPCYCLPKSFTFSNLTLNKKSIQMKSGAIYATPKWFSDDEQRISGSTFNTDGMVRYLHKNSKKRSSNSVVILSSTSNFDVQRSSEESSSSCQTQKNQFAGNKFYAMNLQVKYKRHKLEPYECEPGVCIPGQCNPIECGKRIRKRFMRSSTTNTSTGFRPKATSSETTGRRLISKSQHYNFKERTCIKAPTSQHLSSSRVLPRGDKKAIRIGSTFNFSIQFSKDTCGDSSKVSSRAVPRSLSTGTSLEGKQMKTKGTFGNRIGNRSNESQLNIEMRHKGSSITPKYKRCFCTLQLCGRDPQNKGIKLNTKKVQARSIIIFKTAGQNTKKLKPTTMNKKHDIAKIHSQECEPGVCIPGRCDPHECLKRIKARNRGLHHKGVGTGMISRYASASSNQFGTRQGSTETGSLLKRCFCTAGLHSKNKGKDVKPTKFKDSGSIPESTRNLTVVTISGDALTEKTSILYDRHKQQDTALVMVGGTDVECKISKGKDAHEALTKYSNRETKSPTSYPKYKCAKTCTYCKLINNKNIFLDASKYTEQTSQTNNRKRRNKLNLLEPYECKPGFCIPGQCDPHDCAEKIKKRPSHLKKICHINKCYSKSVNTETMSLKTSNSQSPRHKYARKRRKQTKMLKSPTQRQTQDERVTIQPVKKYTTENTPNRNVVRFGSNFSFSVEFYKENKCDSNDVVVSRQQKEMKTNGQFTAVSLNDTQSQVSGIKKRHNTPSQIDFVKTQHKNEGIRPVLKRCFCTLALKKPLGKDKSIKTLQAKHIDTKSRGTDSPNYRATPRYTDGYNKPKSYKLKPYECEPGICIPGKCNPYECEKFIKKRLFKDAATNKEYKNGIDRKLQYDKPTASKASYGRILMKRCFCTLKLQNAHNQKTFPVLDSNECEPGVCIPGKCCPWDCLKRIKNRTMNDYNVQTKPRTASRGSIVRPLKRCFCTAKLFQQQNKRYTVGRMTVFKTMSPFIPRNNYSKDVTCTPEVNVIGNSYLTHRKISKQIYNDVTNMDKQIRTKSNNIVRNENEESHCLQHEMKTLFPYEPVNFKEYEYRKLLSSTMRQEPAAKTSEVRMIDNKDNLHTEKNQIRQSNIFVHQPSNLSTPIHKFPKKNNHIKIDSYNMQEYLIEKLFKTNLKKSKSERQPKKFSNNTRMSKSVKIPKTNVNTFFKKNCTFKYFPLQSGDACCKENSMSHGTIKNDRHSQDSVNKTRATQSKSTKTVVKNILDCFKNIIKNKTTNEFSAIKICGKGLKMNIPQANFKSNIVTDPGFSCDISKATGDAIRSISETCLIENTIPNEKHESDAHRATNQVKRKILVRKKDRNGIKLTIKGKCPEPRMAIFFNKLGYLKNK